MITYSLISEKGSRIQNEDYIGMYERDDMYCFVVADGLGGHKKGEVASELVVRTIIEEFAYGNLYEFIPKAILNAQDKLLNKQLETGYKNDMKTTVVVLEIRDKIMQWAYVGDTRLYLFDKGKVSYRTEDHSVPQLMVNMGKLNDSQIRNHPDRNKLIRVMGDEWDKPCYTLEKKINVKAGQVVLLCSDGFWELINEKDMEAILNKSKNVEQWLLEMEKYININGNNKKMDNYSAIGIWFN